MSTLPRHDEITLPDILRRTPEELRRLQDRLVAETVRLCYRGHPFYRQVMMRERLSPDDLTGVDDLVKLPITRKEEYLADPEAFRLRVESLPTVMQTLWEVCYTTGTTSGVPAPVYTTTFDRQAHLFDCRRRTEFIDIRWGDTIVNLFPLSSFPMGAYVRAASEAAACGASLVFAHTGRPTEPFHVHRSIDAAIDLIADHRATVLWGIGSFVRRVLNRAEERSARLPHLRLAMITGEAISVAMQDDIRERMARLGSIAAEVVNRYSSTEMGTNMVECLVGSGLHNLSPDQVYLEVVDPDSGRRLPDGDTGLLAFTHLIRRGTVFLRYAVGDLARLDRSPCPHCGRTTSERVSGLSRSGNIRKVKGTLVNVQALCEAIEEVPGIEEYQVVIQAGNWRDGSSEELVLRIATASADAESLSRVVADRVREIAHVSPQVVLATREELFDGDLRAKPQRVVDTRPTNH